MNDSSALRISLRRVFVRIHPDKFQDLPNEACANNIALQRINEIINQPSSLSVDNRETPVINELTLFVRNGEELKKDRVQIEQQAPELWKISIQVTECGYWRSQLALLWEVFYLFCIEPPNCFLDLLKQYAWEPVDSGCIEEFIEKHNNLKEAQERQSMFLSQWQSRHSSFNLHSEIFSLCRELNRRTKILLQVESPMDNCTFDKLKLLKTFLFDNLEQSRVWMSGRIRLVKTPSQVQQHNGNVCLNVFSTLEEWKEILFTEACLEYCQQFAYLDNSLKRIEKHFTQTFKLYRVSCSKEILWNRDWLNMYRSILSHISTLSPLNSRDDSSLLYVIQNIQLLNLQQLQLEFVINDKYLPVNNLNTRHCKLRLILRNQPMQVFQEFYNQVLLLHNVWEKEKDVKNHMEYLISNLQLLSIEFDECVPMKDRRACLERLDRLSLLMKSCLRGLAIFITNKYDISPITGRLSIPYFFGIREFHLFLQNL